VLDVACGRGAMLMSAMQGTRAPALGLGVDISPAMVCAIRHQADNRPDLRLWSAVMDAEALAIAEGHSR
jgi:ubiquinone/menaquinone biosynthesis C-methylase UbiE